MSGGYRVDETVGSSSGLQPQQGYHMRGSYPADSSGNEVANGATNPNTWKTVLQAGGQTLGSSNHMDHGDVRALFGLNPPRARPADFRKPPLDDDGARRRRMRRAALVTRPAARPTTAPTTVAGRPSSKTANGAVGA